MNTSPRPHNTTVIEPLEQRIAPAAVFVFTDVDGDSVRIRSSQGTDLASYVTLSSHGDGQQLELLDLTDSSFAGTNLRFQVTKGAHGDGLVNVGFINATGNDLGHVFVKGDLGKIDAGDGNGVNPAIKSLRTFSMGLLGTSTQGGEQIPLLSIVQLSALQNLGGVDADGGLIRDLLQQLPANAATTGLSDSAQLLLESLRSDANDFLDSSSTAVKNFTGGIPQILKNLSSDVNRSLALSQGELGAFSPQFVTLLDTLRATVNDLLPDGTIPAGVVVLPGGLTAVGINLEGILGTRGNDLPTGVLNLLSTLNSNVHDLNALPNGALPAAVQMLLTDTGTRLDQVINGNNPFDTNLAHDLALLQTNVASVLGFAGQNGGVTGDLVAQLNDIDRGIVGLFDAESILDDPAARDAITSDINGAVGKIKVRGDVSNVFLNINGNVRVAKIGGSLSGDSEVNGGDLFAAGKIGKVKIGKNLVGGHSLNTGLIEANGKIRVINVRGSLVGGEGVHSAALELNNNVKSIFVKGDLDSNEGLFSGSINNESGRIGSLTIRGSVIAGEHSEVAVISTTDDIGKLRIGRSVIGDAAHQVSIAAAGETPQPNGKDLAFRSIAIRGSVQSGQILGGFDADLSAINGLAQISKLRVGKDWIGSSVSAGVEDILGDGFGNQDDQSAPKGASSIVSKIASITIRGAVFGTAESGDHYGFVAEKIGRVKIGNSTFLLDPGFGNDVVELSALTSDVTVREVVPVPV